MKRGDRGKALEGRGETMGKAKSKKRDEDS